MPEQAQCTGCTSTDRPGSSCKPPLAASSHRKSEGRSPDASGASELNLIATDRQCQCSPLHPRSSKRSSASCRCERSSCCIKCPRSVSWRTEDTKRCPSASTFFFAASSPASELQLLRGQPPHLRQLLSCCVPRRAEELRCLLLAPTRLLQPMQLLSTLRELRCSPDRQKHCQPGSTPRHLDAAASPVLALNRFEHPGLSTFNDDQANTLSSCRRYCSLVCGQVSRLAAAQAGVLPAANEAQRVRLSHFLRAPSVAAMGKGHCPP